MNDAKCLKHLEKLITAERGKMTKSTAWSGLVNLSFLLVVATSTRYGTHHPVHASPMIKTQSSHVAISLVAKFHAVRNRFRLVC